MHIYIHIYIYLIYSILFVCTYHTAEASGESLHLELANVDKEGSISVCSIIAQFDRRLSKMIIYYTALHAGISIVNHV